MLNEFLDGNPTEPTEAKAKHTWSQNSKVVTCILNSTDPSISLSLHSYKKATEMCTHLKMIYHQTSKAQKYFIDTKLAKYIVKVINMFNNIIMGFSLCDAERIQ